jgi:hypothetical protein
LGVALMNFLHFFIFASNGRSIPKVDLQFKFLTAPRALSLFQPIRPQAVTAHHFM